MTKPTMTKPTVTKPTVTRTTTTPHQGRETPELKTQNLDAQDLEAMAPNTIGPETTERETTEAETTEAKTHLDADDPEFETAMAWAARQSLDTLSTREQRALVDWLGGSPARVWAFNEALAILDDEVVAQATHAVLDRLTPEAVATPLYATQTPSISSITGQSPARTDGASVDGLSAPAIAACAPPAEDPLHNNQAQTTDRLRHPKPTRATTMGWMWRIQTAPRAAIGAATLGMCALFAALCAAMLWPDTPSSLPSQPIVYAASDSAGTASTLPDGSAITLNKHSRLSTYFTTNARAVRLAHGEAVFDVATDIDRPFVVKSDLVDVRVRGTVFNVDAWGDGVRVEVLEGVVELARPGTPLAFATLTAGTGATIDGRGRTTQFSFDLDTFAGWQDDWIIARAMGLAEVAAKLDRHYTGQVRLADGARCENPLFGRFRLSQTRNSLEQIAAACGLQVVMDGDVFVLSSLTP